MLKQEGQHCYEYAGVFAGYNVEHVLATFEIGANVQLQCFRLFIYGWISLFCHELHYLPQGLASVFVILTSGDEFSLSGSLVA
jgi:hypothetical protein